MTRKSRTTIIAVLLLLAVALYFIAGTYARYASEFSGNGTVTVAKWNVRVAGNDDESEFTIDLSPNKDDNIVADRIAPSYTATGTVELDLSETEVAVELKAEVGDLSGTILEGNDKVKVETSIEPISSASPASGDAPKGYTIALPDGQAFTSDNGKYTVKVTVKWENDASPSQDPTDTAAGKKGGETSGEVKIPVKLTVAQQVKNN